MQIDCLAPLALITLIFGSGLISVVVVIPLHIFVRQLGIREFMAIIDKKSENKGNIYRSNQFVGETTSPIAQTFIRFIQLLEIN